VIWNYQNNIDAQSPVRRARGRVRRGSYATLFQDGLKLQRARPANGPIILDPVCSVTWLVNVGGPTLVFQLNKGIETIFVSG